MVDASTEAIAKALLDVGAGWDEQKLLTVDCSLDRLNACGTQRPVVKPHSGVRWSLSV